MQGSSSSTAASIRANKKATADANKAAREAGNLQGSVRSTRANKSLRSSRASNTTRGHGQGSTAKLVQVRDLCKVAGQALELLLEHLACLLVSLIHHGMRAGCP